MKANELMIGDWVGFLPTWKNEDGSIGRDGDPNDPIPFKVEMVCWNCVVLDDKDGSSFDADDISLYPIPLTLEILEKNKFVKFIAEQYMLPAGGNEWIVTIIPNLDSAPNSNGTMLIAIKNIYTDAKIAITYVHQLQHALKLCGIDKTIEL